MYNVRIVDIYKKKEKFNYDLNITINMFKKELHNAHLVINR